MWKRLTIALNQNIELRTLTETATYQFLTVVLAPYCYLRETIGLLLPIDRYHLRELSDKKSHERRSVTKI